MRIERLRAAGGELERFTFPRYRALLASLDETPHAAFALGAWVGSRPAGVVLFSKLDGTRRHLLSVMVDPLLRRQAIGTRLLQAGEAAAAEDGARALATVHSSRTPCRVAFEALLRRCAWETPREHDTRICGRAGWAHRARAAWGPIIGRWERGGYSSSAWDRMTEADRRELAEVVSRLPPDQQAMSPLSLELPVVPALSLVLRRRGRIVGWIAGKRGVPPNSIHYSHGYALPEVQRLGWLIAGMRDVCERQAALMGEASLTLYETDAANRDMRRFVEKHLAPFTEWIDARFVTEKVLR